MVEEVATPLKSVYQGCLSLWMVVVVVGGQGCLGKNSRDLLIGSKKTPARHRGVRQIQAFDPTEPHRLKKWKIMNYLYGSTNGIEAWFAWELISSSYTIVPTRRCFSVAQATQWPRRDTFFSKPSRCPLRSEVSPVGDWQWRLGGQRDPCSTAMAGDGRNSPRRSLMMMTMMPWGGIWT